MHVHVGPSRLQLAALGDENGQLGSVVRAGLHVFDFAHGEHAVDDRTEHHVLVVQPLTLIAGDEKLTPVRIHAAVGHGEQTGFGVFVEEVLVSERLALVDAHRSRTVALDEVATLNHEVLNDSMERCLEVAERDVLFAVLSGAELTKVLRCPRRLISIQLHHYATGGRTTDCHVEEDDGVGGVLLLRVRFGHGSRVLAYCCSGRRYCC